MKKLWFVTLMAVFPVLIALGAAPLNTGEPGLRESLSVPAQQDSDLGCCVLQTDPVTCFWTNRAFCEDKAKQAKVSFDFTKDKRCNDLEACKKAGETTGRECR